MQWCVKSYWNYMNWSCKYCFQFYFLRSWWLPPHSSNTCYHCTGKPIPLTDLNAFSATHYHIPEFAVERAPQEQQVILNYMEECVRLEREGVGWGERKKFLKSLIPFLRHLVLFLDNDCSLVDHLLTTIKFASGPKMFCLSACYEHSVLFEISCCYLFKGLSS